MRTALRLLTLLACVATPPSPLTAAEADRADQRAVTVESTLKDLSRSNDAAIGRQGVTPVPGEDALGRPRAIVEPEPPPDTAAVVTGEVQSSLHKLKRDTVISRTPDGRKARVQDNAEP